MKNLLATIAAVVLAVIALGTFIHTEIGSVKDELGVRMDGFDRVDRLSERVDSIVTWSTIWQRLHRRRNPIPGTGVSSFKLPNLAALSFSGGGFFHAGLD